MYARRVDFQLATNKLSFFSRSILLIYCSSDEIYFVHYIYSVYSIRLNKQYNTNRADLIIYLLNAIQSQYNIKYCVVNYNPYGNFNLEYFSANFSITVFYVLLRFNLLNIKNEYY